MVGKKVLAGTAAVVLISGITLAWFHFAKPGTGTSAKSTPKFANSEEFQKQLQAKRQKVLTSKEALAFKEQSLETIRDALTGTRVKSREEMLEAGIHVTDHLGASSLPMTFRKNVAEIILTYLEKLTKSDITPHERRSIALSSRLFSKLDLDKTTEPQENAGLRKRFVALIQAEAPGVIKEAVLESAATLNPVMPEVVAEIRKLLDSTDSASVQKALYMVSQLREPRVRIQLLTHLESRFDQVPDSMQPIALKYILRFHPTPKTLEKRVADASKRNEEAWVEAFLYSIERTGWHRKYSARIDQIAKTAESPIIRRRAQFLRDRVPASEKTGVSK